MSVTFMEEKRRKMFEDRSAIFTVTFRDDVMIERSIRRSFRAEVANDRDLMERVVEWKYAARRQGKVLILDFVPPWKAKILRLFGVHTGEQ